MDKLNINNIEIKIVDKWCSKAIIELYKTAGWWSSNDEPPSIIEDLISKSFLFAVAVDKKTGKTIGTARVISDSVSDAYIQDFVVLPEYRGLGVGKALINTLVDDCLSRGIRWIGLIAEPGTEKFYEKIGFNTMRNHVPMKYKSQV